MPAGGPGYAPRPAGGPAGSPGAPGVPPKEGDDRARRKPHRVVEFPGGSTDEDRRKASNTAAKKKPSFAPAPVVSEDGESPMRLKSNNRRKKHRGGMEQREEVKPVGKRKIRIDEHIRLSDLAHQMGVKAQAIIKVLFGMGMMATINQALDMDTATLLAGEFGHEVENVSFDEQEFLTASTPDTAEDLKPRPPVVTIMATSTTARPRCLTPSARRASPRAKRAASPSTSAPTTSPRAAAKSCSSTRPATKPSPPCAPAAPR